MAKETIQQKIFSLIKKRSDSRVKDSLINLFYLKKKGYSIGELAELILVENINKRIRGISAVHVGRKTKNEWDPKTDIVINLEGVDVPFSVKTSSYDRLKIKNGISKSLIQCITDKKLDKKYAIDKIKKELSTNLFILHLTRKKDKFYLDLKKININSFDSIKFSKKHIILKDVQKNSIVFFDLERLAIYVYSKFISIVDSFELGKDNSQDKKFKGESLLIEKIITNVCLCDIPVLRKIDKFLDKKVE